MTKSSNDGGSSTSSNGGALHVLAVMGEPFLSKCINILLMIVGCVIQATILTLMLSHASQMVISMLNTRFHR